MVFLLSLSNRVFFVVVVFLLSPIKCNIFPFIVSFCLVIYFISYFLLMLVVFFSC